MFEILLVSVENMRKKVHILALLLAIILVSGCISGKVIAEESKEPKLLEFKRPIIVDNISITFDSIWITDKTDLYVADDGYKFAIIYISAKNIGYEKKYFPLDFYDMKMTVNSGYKYEYHTASKDLFDMRPTDTEKGYVVFEILKDTYPTELYIENDIHTEHCLKMQLAPHYEYERECIEKSILPISIKGYECTNNYECSNGFICADNKCIKGECMSNSDCPQNKPACSEHKCVECNTKSDCDILAECNNHKCAECITDSDCIYGFGSACNNNKCVECNTNSDCRYPSKPACNNNKCVECNRDSDCRYSSEHICYNHICVECNTNTDCTFSNACYEHKCVECNTDSECTNTLTPACYNHRCVECLKNSDCISEKPICNKQYDQNHCVECLINSDCKNPEKPYCYSVPHQCAECLKNSDCPDENNHCVAGHCYY